MEEGLGWPDDRSQDRRINMEASKFGWNRGFGEGKHISSLRASGEQS